MFNQGDLVVVVNNGGVENLLTLNKTYIVCKYNFSILPNNNLIDIATFIINDNGNIDWFDGSRFNLNIKEMRKLKLEKLCLR